MRVACLLVTHLRAKVEMYRHSHLKDEPIHALLHEAGDIAEGAHLWYTGLRPRSNRVRRCAVPSRASAGRLLGPMMQCPRRSAIIEWL